MTLLIDADYLAYKTCAACEDEADFGDDVIVVTSRFSEVLVMFKRELENICRRIGYFDDITLFFSSSTNFRKTISPDYKGHRNRKKPCGYKRLLNWCGDNYVTIMIDNLEADDALGIFATDPVEAQAGHILCSPDKDMRQIPGLLYDLTNPVTEITKEEGDLWHFIQTMSGDQTDGYAGVPTIGTKRAAAILEKEGCNWKAVLDTFISKGMTEEDALRNARLAKILQFENFDHDANIPILWTPTTSSNGVDSGTKLQAEASAGSAA
jgi:DNA polymerase I